MMNGRRFSESDRNMTSTNSRAADKTIKKFHDVWREFFVKLSRIDAEFEKHINSGSLRSTGATADCVNFEIDPIVLNIKENPNKSQRKLFVVVRGKISLNLVSQSEDFLTTREFSTEVGYFRETSTGGLEHVLGMHFDLSVDEVGHPVFHSQFQSYSKFSEYVYRHIQKQKEPLDHVDKLLKRVRIPTPQMDVLSLFIQVCADHFISIRSAQEVHARFEDLLKTNNKLVGAAWRSEKLKSQQAAKCFRSGHWYPFLSQ